ncbi:RNA polymerase sigma factor SigJ [Actinacidiphila bryophytorum]|uniref:RNA polymerase sigma-70 factor, ECF subfamily n=1 Tax=Actinacidiphila bryophytorum TaxID=1436133 RepID=A0A9W4MLC3_9ACTN|nr:RNA polymerase sigma factor SigJ [Actinacidiphila bryophytorum]MBM9440227.1 RNA polymerase sigma factor SigJ [Actinacidiphila bryophytorum]MBN6546524.1 RNA polymerase sigma factor SigJ [Actinacidiphila bryophytorum]CAG7658371.1 RNA polymerase sigma-70 factor, ECF subfamily [Actinacidiphila bryophytorum]
MSDTPIRQHTAAAGDRATEVFVNHRELLFSVVYNMLGSVSDTEDVLQETWLAWTRRSGKAAGADIDNPRAYLVRIAVNQALARQASIIRRRETYVGPWLPEPLATGAQQPADQPQAAQATDAAESALRNESVSMAMLVVLETLTPLERAVFVLHEVFGYPHTEIAAILERSPSAIRQLAHRAREHVQARRPRYQADRQLQRQVTERFIAAALGGDLAELMSLLAPDVTLWTDGGGKVSAALRPVSGQEKVAKLVTGYAANRLPDTVDIRYRQVNGDPSVVVFSGDSPTAVMVVDLDADSDKVTDIYLVTNPDKLSGVSAAQAGGGGGEDGPAAP